MVQDKDCEYEEENKEDREHYNKLGSLLNEWGRIDKAIQRMKEERIVVRRYCDFCVYEFKIIYLYSLRSSLAKINTVPSGILVDLKEIGKDLHTTE
jgi:hypothetical protein